MQNVKVDRDKYIGGSDIPVIMEISPFKTRWELLQEKAGLVEDEFDGNEYTEYGNIMEPKIRDFINESQKDKFVEGKNIENDIRCHTDGINKTTVLEIKTTSQIHENVNEYKIYLVQLLFYMKYTKRKKGILAVYARPKDFNTDFNDKVLAVYEINIKDYKELVNDIDLALDEFRADLTRVKENPFLTEADLEPQDLKELAEECRELLQDVEPKNKRLEAVKLELKAKMDAYGKKTLKADNVKVVRVADGVDTITKKFDEKLFKEENEELYKKYVTEIAKKGKAGYVKITLGGNENDK